MSEQPAPGSPASRAPKWLLPGTAGFLLGVLSIVLVLVGAALLEESSPPRYTYPLALGQKLDEQAAVEATRKALEASGVDLTDAAPIRYHSPENPNVFAVNELNPDMGIVRWKVPSKQTRYNYSVRVERKGTNLVVSIYRPK